MIKSKRNKTTSKPTASKRTAEQRFLGPELGELLDQVVSELGPSAEISEVNKIRSGGVAGFFCREEYEIIVDAGGVARQEKVGAGSAAPAGGQTATIAAPKAGQGPPEQHSEPADERIRASSETLQTDIAPADDRAADGQTPDRSAEPASADGASEVFGGPRPRTLDGSDERFLALLERRLEETAEAEAPVTGRTIRRQTRRPASRTGQGRPSIELAVPALSATDAGTSTLAVSPSRKIPIEVADPVPEDGFWSSTRLAGQELAALLPAESSFLAVLGPLSLTTPVVRRIRSETALSAADVVVLTDRAEIISEPQWQLVRSGHQLVEVAAERAGQPTMFVIDVPVELPQWVAPLQQRLRLAGVTVFRYAVPGTPPPGQLQRYRLGSDVPYILDLVSRVDPERLVELIDQQHPVGSVGGATLTAELLVAMREQVGGGR